MRRFLVLTFLLVIVGGFIIQLGLIIPGVSYWLGKLPGDLMLKKGKLIFFFPFASAALVAMIISAVISLVFRRGWFV